MKRLITRACESLGYTFIGTWRLDAYVFARHLRRLFTLLEIDCVLDVGANAGQYYDFLRREVGFAGTVVSFEPIPEHVRQMTRRALPDAKWRIEQRALGSKRGAATFNVMSETEFSSFLKPDHSATAQFEERNRVSETISVQVETLDDVLPLLEVELGLKRYYLKLDTQGYDLEVLNGASACLPKIRGLQTEASVTPIYQGMPDFATTIREIERKGFSISGIFPNNAGHFPRLLEFDCCMVNERYVAKAVNGAAARLDAGRERLDPPPRE